MAPLDCGHTLLCEFSDDSGMNCDGACGKDNISPGIPLIGCRVCNEDVCSDCWTEKSLNVLGWTDLHFCATGKRDKKYDSVKLKNDNFGWCPIKWASFTGNLDFLRIYFERTTLTDGFYLTDRNEQNILMLACHSENLEVVKLICDKYDIAQKRYNASILVDNYGRNLICHAASSLPEILDYILNTIYLQGEKEILLKQLNIQNTAGYTLIQEAVIAGKVEIVKILLRYGADVNNLGEAGLSPLLLALQSHNEVVTERMVVALLENGASQEIGIESSDNGMSPLMVCAADGNIGLSKVLLKFGADKGFKDVDGAGVMYYAVKNLSACSKDADDDDFHDTKDYSKVCAFFIENGVEIDSADKSGVTPLLLACEEDNIESAKVLIASKNVNLNQSTVDGNTALHSAAKNANYELVELLINHGANVSIRNNLGFYPLHSAMENEAQNPKVVELLLKFGAKSHVNSVTHDDLLTPLHIGVIYCSDKVIRVLVEQGEADVNAIDKDGDTPLHNAAGKQPNGEDRVEVVKYLISSGALYKTAANAKGFTPLAVAAAALNREVAAVFVRNGAEMISVPSSQLSQSSGSRNGGPSSESQEHQIQKKRKMDAGE